MGESGVLPSRRLLWSLGLGMVGLYLLVAVLAYFVSYPVDLPALEGAPSATPLNNPTGWIGAHLAHRLVYRGFGWIGILFPLALLYMSLQWSRRKPIRLKVLGWGLVALYLVSTFGGWLVQAGLAEDLIWCGSVGAGLTAWISLYIGPVGLFLVWALLAGLAAWALWTSLRPRKEQKEQEEAEAPPLINPPSRLKNPPRRTRFPALLVRSGSPPDADKALLRRSPSYLGRGRACGSFFGLSFAHRDDRAPKRS